MINEQIRCKEVRVIGEEGQQLGVMALRDALNNISYIVTNNNAKIVVQGEGYIYDYSPQAGTIISNEEIIRLNLKAPNK